MCLCVACYSAVVIQYCENDEERKEGRKERIEKLFFLWLIIEFVFPTNCWFWQLHPHLVSLYVKDSFSKKSFYKQQYWLFGTSVLGTERTLLMTTHNTHKQTNTDRGSACLEDRTLCCLMPVWLMGQSSRFIKQSSAGICRVCQTNKRSFPVTQSSLLC